MLRLLAVLVLALPAFAEPPQKYALLVGVNKYKLTAMNTPAPLEYAEADVTDLAALLKASGYEVELLAGAKATKAAIREAIANLKGRGNSDGVLLVALAGHGVQMEKDDDACFCPYDTSVRGAERLGVKVLDRNGQANIEPDPVSLVKITSIVDAFKLSPTGTRILLAHCCRNDPSADPAAAGSAAASRPTACPTTPPCC